MPIPPRPEVLKTEEAIHGSAQSCELQGFGINSSSVIDFSANVNPFGPSPHAVAALAKVRLDQYPDRNAADLRKALSKHLDVSPDQLLAGNGSSELLHLIGLAYLRPGDRALIVGPTYAEYARVAANMGAHCTHCHSTAETDFAVPVRAVSAALQSVRPRVAFLCNPNNPTGQWLDAEIIREWAREFDETLFVIDEAYIEFVPQLSSLAGASEQNIVVLRSLTKAYGLAGLRLGYAVADPAVIGNLCRVRPPWSVNAVAQACGIAALNDQDHVQRSLSRLIEAKQALVTDLQSLGWKPVPSATPFFLLPVGDADRMRTKLLRSKILVRSCSSFGLPTFLRIGTRNAADNQRLIDAFKADLS